MKLLKNTTVSDITLSETGITVQASGQYEVNTTEYNLLASDDSITELTTYINSGDIVVNDGSQDLTVANGVALARAIDFLRSSDSALNIRFLASPQRSNGFAKKNVQEAIEEAKQNAEGFPRSSIRSIQNGTIGNNDWLGPNELMPDTPMAVFPIKTKINEITWANDIDQTNRQFRIQFRSISKTGTIFYTLDVDSPNPGYGYVDAVNQVFSAGTAIFAQYKDDGNNCRDLSITLWISRVED